MPVGPLGAQLITGYRVAVLQIASVLSAPSTPLSIGQRVAEDAASLGGEELVNHGPKPQQPPLPSQYSIPRVGVQFKCSAVSCQMEKEAVKSRILRDQ